MTELLIDYRIAVTGDRVGTQAQDRWSGAVTLWTKTEQEALVIVEQIHYDGDWTAIIERRLLDPDKPQGQRYLRMEHVLRVEHVATIHTDRSQA